MTCPPEVYARVEATILRIEEGRRIPHDHDGQNYLNDPSRGAKLPGGTMHRDGLFLEFVHVPGASWTDNHYTGPVCGVKADGGPAWGKERLVARGGKLDAATKKLTGHDALYYSPDHYQSFCELIEPD